MELKLEEGLKKSQILKRTRCKFYLSHKVIEECKVTKLALREALVGGYTYQVDLYETGRNAKGHIFYKMTIHLL